MVSLSFSHWKLAKTGAFQVAFSVLFGTYCAGRMESRSNRYVPTVDHSLAVSVPLRIYRFDYKCNTGSGSVPSFPIDVSGRRS